MNIIESILNKVIPSRSNASVTSRPSPLLPPEAAAKPEPAVDVTEILQQRVAQKGQPLDWQHSIVDLLKALDLDSSLTARKQLAQELNFSGNTSDSAAMNVWLHEEVMKKLAENGGQLPDSIRH